MRDNRNLFTSLQIWYKHRTTSIPLLVIGKQYFQDAPSVKEFTQAINSLRITH